MNIYKHSKSLGALLLLSNLYYFEWLRTYPHECYIANGKQSVTLQLIFRDITQLCSKGCPYSILIHGRKCRKNFSCHSEACCMTAFQGGIKANWKLSVCHEKVWRWQFIHLGKLIMSIIKHNLAMMPPSKDSSDAS